MPPILFARADRQPTTRIRVPGPLSHLYPFRLSAPPVMSSDDFEANVLCRNLDERGA
jgi:hypothetical protein